MFRSLMTTIRELYLYLFMLKHSVKLRPYIYLVMWQHVVERHVCKLYRFQIARCNDKNSIIRPTENRET